MAGPLVDPTTVEPDPIAQIPSDRLQLARKYYSDDEIRNWYKTEANQTLMRQRRGEPVPKTNWEGVDITTGVPAGLRAQASFKSSPEGRMDFYKKQFGNENVRTSPGGSIEFKKDDGQWARVDETGLSVADIADLAGDIPELAGMMAIPALRALKPIGEAVKASRTARVATSMGAGAAGGNVVKQAAGQALPGNEGISLTDPLMAAVGAQVLGAYNQYSPGINTTRVLTNSEKFLENYLQKRLSNPETAARIKEGLELSQKTGIPLNLAEITGDPVIKTLLGFAHRSSAGQPLAMAEAAEKQTAAQAMLQRLMGELAGPRGFENPNFAEAATGAARNVMKDIQGGLDTQSKAMGHILNLPDASASTIPLTNRSRYLQSLADYYRSMGSREHGETAKEIERLIGDTTADVSGQRMGNLRVMQQYLQDAGKEGFGGLPEKEFPRLAAMAKTQESRKLWEATRKDLEEATKSNPLAKRLLDARTRTGELLSTREGVESLPLLAFMNSKGMLGEAMKGGVPATADKIFPFLIKGMHEGSISPGEMGHMMKILSVTSPRIADQFAHEILGQAVKAGMHEKGFNIAAATKALPEMRYMEAIYKDLWNKGTQTRGMNMAVDLQMLMRALSRIDKFGLGIPESPATQITSLGSKLASGEFSGAGKQAFAQFFLPQLVARVSHNPEIRQKLLDYVTKNTANEEAPTFMASFLKNTLPAVIYETGSSQKQRNQAGFGGK